MKKPKKYNIDSFEKLCNVVNEENIERFIPDLAGWLLYYAYVISKFRKEHPEETRGKSNIQIVKGAFIWYDDGKNDFKGVDLINNETGEIVEHR